MDLNDKLSDEENLQLSDKEIFIRIWASPRLVFKYLNDNNYDKFVPVLLVLAGIARTFDQSSSNNSGDDLPLIAIIALCTILGGLLGWITFYIYAALVSWTGKWLKGKGNTKSLLRMIAHAMIPSIAALTLFIPHIVLFGNGIFQSHMDIYSQGTFSAVVFYITSLLQLTLAVWTLVIFVVGISEVQKISIGKSILNLILPGLVIVVPIMLIAILVYS